MGLRKQKPSSLFQCMRPSRVSQHESGIENTRAPYIRVFLNLLNHAIVEGTGVAEKPARNIVGMFQPISGIVQPLGSSLE